MNHKRIDAMSTPVTAVATLLLAASAMAGDEPDRRLGDHPAVVVQRLHKAAGYDYASKFYPHPAGLYLHAAPPRDATDQALAGGKAPSAQRALAARSRDADTTPVR